MRACSEFAYCFLERGARLHRYHVFVLSLPYAQIDHATSAARGEWSCLTHLAYPIIASSMFLLRNYLYALPRGLSTIEISSICRVDAARDCWDDIRHIRCLQ